MEMRMGRSLDEVIAELPPARREGIEARYQELRQRIDRLGASHQIAGEACADTTAEPKTR